MQRLTKASGRVPRVVALLRGGLRRLLAGAVPRAARRRLSWSWIRRACRSSRHARRVKTDRIDVEKLLHTLIAWCRGERHVCSMVVIPGAAEEDLRRSHRERDRLVRERTAHINRIKGLLFAQGIRGINVKRSRYKTLTPADLVTGDGRPLPERLSPRDRARDREAGPGAGAARRAIERERDLAPTLL